MKLKKKTLNKLKGLKEMDPIGTVVKSYVKKNGDMVIIIKDCIFTAEELNMMLTNVMNAI